MGEGMVRADTGKVDKVPLKENENENDHSS